MEEKVYDGDDNSAATEQSVATCTETNGCTDACDDVVVKIDNLSKKYPRAKDYAVKNVSFVCRRGEIVGLLGVNGAGKSTTLKCLTGILPFKEGEITVLGHSVKGDGMKAKQKFGFVTDNHAVFVKMTGLEYVAFMADIYGVPADVRDKRLEELQKCFMLGDKIANLISSYSHGMKQKICMMGSLIHNPELWVLDEPMLGLDPRTMNAVSQFMKDYAAQGNTILFSTHNLDAVRRICDRAIVIRGGVVEADLVVDDLRDNQLSEYFLQEEAEAE